MKNRLTFANVINILLDNKKKTYPQHKLICDLFAEYLGKSDYYKWATYITIFVTI